MQDLIEITDSINTVSTKFQESKAVWTSLNDLLKSIETALADPRWQGNANDKSINIHQAVTLYKEKIELLYPDIQASLDQLVVDKDSFVSNSDLIDLINTI
ncbi:MAG: hypothetical protein FWH40_01265 [Coriobacteriia bacterium]|nr:hypothetical protein [Coriobacteriia bacterium]